MIILNKKLNYLIFFYFFIFIGQSCDIINPTVMVPTYFHIDSVHINMSYYNNISYSHKISTIWVYYNNSPVGVFDLPATFPVMATGDGTLEVSPGIDVDGLTSQLQIYPFYTIDTFKFSAQPGKTIQHLPQSTYYSSLHFFTISDQSNLGFAQCGGTTGIRVVNDPTMEYEPPYHCAGIFLSSPGDSSIDSSIKFTIPNSSTNGAAFIELNYKSSVPFYLGLQATISGVATSTPYYLTGIYPNTTWGKFYLNVGDFNAKVQGNTYTLFVKTSLPDGQANGALLLDHIQLVSF